MKKIVINGRFLEQQVTGVQRTAKEIVKALDSIVDDGMIEIAISNKVVDIPQYEKIKVVKLGNLKDKLWEQISYPLYLYKKNAIGVNLCNTAPIIKPDIVIIHDIRFIGDKVDFDKFKDKIKNKWQIIQSWFLCKYAKQLLTVSNFSKLEIEKYYKVSENKIEIIYNGWQHFNKIESDERILNKYNFLEKKKYYFAMSSIAKHKNFKWVLNVAKNNPNLTFVIAGSINPKYFSETLNLKELSNVFYLGYVSDQEAKALMENCKAFLFPSLYEGFGIPPLEALSVGTKIIVSDIPCLTEIYKESAYYINPYCYDINLDNIRFKDENENESILNIYDWKKSAKKLYNVIERICN